MYDARDFQADFKEFRQSQLLWHPTTWLIGVAAGVYGGIEMYQIREAHRAAGEALQFPWLWLDRTVDVTVGAILQITLLFCAVWFLVGIIDHLNPWLRQGLLLIVYLVIFGLQYIL